MDFQNNRMDFDAHPLPVTPISVYAPAMSETVVCKEWLPSCDEGLKPKEGMVFENVEECEKFYETYADNAGFRVCRSSSRLDKSGVMMYKYFVCSKNGSYPDKHILLGKKRVRQGKMTKEGCKAMVGFMKVAGNKYQIFKFHEGHSHEGDTPAKHYVPRSKMGTKSVHQTLPKASSGADFDPSTHPHTDEQAGFHGVGCSEEDLNDFQMDLRISIKDSNADMFIENFRKKQELNPSFYFAYEVDDDGGLKHIFWADGISRRNYVLYGDFVSFNTTDDTNRYKMTFVSFTGVDNHRLCVTFGAALLGNEKEESFVWLFKKFVDAMWGHKPLCIMSHQHPSVIFAIDRVFDTSSHKFCVMHIMRTLPEKVGASLCGDAAFISQFKSCIYRSETPEEFELSWRLVINGFGLERNDWLTHLYRIRVMWVPAYFKNLFSGGILKTMSVSEDGCFSNFSSSSSSLVEFWPRFESVVEEQRHRQSRVDHMTFSSMPELKTKGDLERHAGTIYTHANFYKFQDEYLNALLDCETCEIKNVGEGVMISIVDASQEGKIRHVAYKPSNHVAHCSCKMFEGEGIPCRHILFILKGKNLKELPSYYIVNRWTKMANTKTLFDLKGSGLKGYQADELQKLISRTWIEFLNCMELAGRDAGKIATTLNAVTGAHRQLGGMKENTCQSRAKTKEFEFPVESRARSEADASSSEPAQQKPKRLCRSCGKLAHHDSRNCESKTKTREFELCNESRTQSQADVSSSEPAQQKPKRLCRSCGELAHHDSRNCESRTRSQVKDSSSGNVQPKPKRLCRCCGELAHHDSRNCPSNTSCNLRGW